MAEMWLVTCPKCDQQFKVLPEQARIHCGQASTDCTCPDCGQQFIAEEDYLVWLGIKGPIPQEVVGE